MICELFPFQKQAVNDMRLRVAMALNNYRMLKIPQVVSLQAPTGSGKTIIMSALIEDIFYGSEQFTEQPDAIFVWLSDSPQLNEQSKQKIELKAEEAGVTPKEFVDNVSGQIKGIWDLMNTSYDKFIRTTDEDHEKQVQKIFKKLGVDITCEPVLKK